MNLLTLLRAPRAGTSVRNDFATDPYGIEAALQQRKAARPARRQAALQGRGRDDDMVTF